MKNLKIEVEVVTLVNIERMCMDYLIEHPEGAIVIGISARKALVLVSSKIQSVASKIMKLQDEFDIEQDMEKRDKIAKRVRKLRRDSILKLDENVINAFDHIIEFSSRMGRRYELNGFENTITEYILFHRQ